MFRLRSGYPAVVLLAASFLGGAALAQTPSGRITGVVRDAQGGALAGARVTATNRTSGGTRGASTGSDGTYSIPNLTSGTYTVSATHIGFRRFARADVQVSGESRVDITLEVVPLQAIMVTATLREEEVANVPFSIAAPTAQILRSRGAENIEDISVNLAGISVQNLGPGQSQVAMRGASSGQIARDQPGVKEQVGAYLDDVPISLSLFTPDMDLFDISRVEVLRGPQGTLFGSGSLSGTVRYITNQPELGVNSFFGELGANAISNGSVGGNLKLGVNAPLGEKAAARVAGWYNRLGGWMDAVQPDFSVNENVNTGTRAGIRAALRLEPSDRFSITPRVTFQKVEMDGWNRIDVFNILANPYTTSRPPVTLGERQLFTQLDEPFTDDYFLGDARIRYDFGGLSLTSVTSVTSRDILVVRDATALTASITGGSIGLSEAIYTLDAPLDDATTVSGFSQELRLAGGSGNLRWLTGAFYTTNTRDYGQSLLVSGFQDASGIPTVGLRAAKDVLFFSDLSYELKQLALFGEATLSLGRSFDITGGLRYYDFSEDRDQVFDGIFAHDSTGTKVVSQPGSTDADGIVPRIMASWRATDLVTLNAQASKGFRLGGINDPLNVPLCTATDLETFSGRDSWTDETAWNYELGAKTLLMSGKGSLNVSAYNMDITNMQLTVTAGSCSSRLVFNLPETRTTGMEIELTANPNERLDLALSTSFNNAELRSTLTSTSSTGAVTVVSGIEAGKRLPSVPKFQASAAATYRWPFRPGTSAFLSGSYSYVGSRITQIDDHAPGFGTVDLNSFGDNTIGGPLTQSTFTFDRELPAYSLVNLRVGLAKSTNWDVALFVSNVTDERAFLALDRERGLRARVGYLTNQPRTIGVTMAFQR
jgi:iron complex outermembrane receptor protein